jgi:hypothetical protein
MSRSFKKKYGLRSAMSQKRVRCVIMRPPILRSNQCDPIPLRSSANATSFPLLLVVRIISHAWHSPAIHYNDARN